jgi:acyl-CoA synthetase (AMP-forming)/AMP-acid ligase II
MQKIDSDDFIRMAHHYKVEKAYMTPKMLSSIVKNEDLRQKQVMSKLNHIVTLESGLSPELQIEAAEKLQLRVKQAYALTEGQFLCFADNYKTILNSCGKVLPNTTVKVVKSSGEEVKVFGEVGELWFHGPQLMSGYCKDQQATHAVLKDGWLHTGDLGFVKEDGSVYILDRLKSMIKTQFGSVSPAELEEVIAKHPAVADVCVVGVPSIESYQEETIKAFVVCKPNQEANAEDIMQFVNNQVAANKQVKAVEFLDSIPKSPSGKVLRSILFKMRGLQ